MTVFVSSPYSHINETTKEERVHLTAKFCQRIIKRGIHAISPVVYGVALIEKGKDRMDDDWSQWMNFCKEMILNASVVYVLNLPGWEKSEGVMAEIKFARQLERQIVLVDYNVDEDGEIKVLLDL